MLVMRIMIFATAIVIFPAIIGYCDDQIELGVKIVADERPEQITVEEEETGQSIPLTQVANGYTYKITLPITGGSELVVPYRLVASWGETKEQIFLGLRPLPFKNKKLNISIYHKNGKCDYKALCEIEALGTDFGSTLQRYFRARTYHKMWRFQNKQPEHERAIQSAKLWFDAAYNLVRLKSIFRMDTEIRDIMNEYEKLAEKDPGFRKRYHNYVPVQYVQNINSQVVAMDWVFVGYIPKLVSEGELDKAKALNELALTTFSNSKKEIQQVIRSNQGINSKLLEDNAKYIQTLKAQIR